MLLKPGDFETDSTWIPRLGWSRKAGFSQVHFLRVVSYSVISAPCDSSHYFFCAHLFIATMTSLVRTNTFVRAHPFGKLSGWCASRASGQQLWSAVGRNDRRVCLSLSPSKIHSLVIGQWIVPYKMFWQLCFRAAAVFNTKRPLDLGHNYNECYMFHIICESFLNLGLVNPVKGYFLEEHTLLRYFYSDSACVAPKYTRSQNYLL